MTATITVDRERLRRTTALHVLCERARQHPIWWLSARSNSAFIASAAGGIMQRWSPDTRVHCKALASHAASAQRSWETSTKNGCSAIWPRNRSVQFPMASIRLRRWPRSSTRCAMAEPSIFVAGNTRNMSTRSCRSSTASRSARNRRYRRFRDVRLCASQAASLTRIAGQRARGHGLEWLEAKILLVG